MLHAQIDITGMLWIAKGLDFVLCVKVHKNIEMNKTQKKLLARLMAVTNSLGGTLDGTATCEQKYIDRQRAHRLSYKVIYGLFGDNPKQSLS